MVPTYRDIIHEWLSRNTDICKKKNLADARGLWRILNIHPGGCPKFVNEFTRADANACACIAYVGRASDERKRNRVNPPTIHRDFRQLVEVIVTGRNLSLSMFSDVNCRLIARDDFQET